MPPRRYYFRSTDGDALGPVSLNVVAEMIRADRVKANTPISTDGQQFKPMKSFPELATLLSVEVETDLPEDADDEVMEVPPTYSGSLSEVSFPKLLFHFFAAKANGRLLLANQQVRKEIYLVNGKPVAAVSNLARDQLGQHLVRSEVISEQQLQRVLAEISNKHERLGDHLIQQGIVNPHDLVGHLAEQLLQKIYEVFNWRVGQYAFFDGQQYKGSLLPMNMNPWEILAEGVRQGYEEKELEELLRPLMARVLVRRENEHLHVNQLGLHPRELKIFKLATGKRSLGGLLETLQEDDRDYDKALRMVYMGLELELLALGDEAEEDLPLPGEVNDAVQWDNLMAQAAGEAPTADDPEEDAAFLATPPVSRAEQSLLEKLNLMKEMNYFEMLGVEQTVTSGEVTKAFLRAAREYHPDQVPPDAPEKVRALSADIFSLLNDAQQKLSNDKSREEYILALEAGHEDGNVDISSIVEAETAFQKGEVLLNARKFDKALEEFEEAVKLNQDEGEFHIYRGYAMFMANPDADENFRRGCIDIILRGLKMRNNNVANGFLFLGRIEAAAGDDEKATKMFKKAMTIDSNHVEATRELRLINMRKGKDKDKKKFWRRK